MDGGGSKYPPRPATLRQGGSGGLPGLHPHRAAPEGQAPKSYREMQDDLKKPHATPRNWTEQDFPGLFRAMGGDNRSVNGGLADRPAPPPTGVGAAEGSGRRPSGLSADHLSVSLAGHQGGAPRWGGACHRR